MIDTDTLKSQIDLRHLAGQYTDLDGSKEQCGPCPKCGGTDRFHVTAEWYFCRKCHPKRGDAIEFVRWLKGLDFRAACDLLAGGRLPTLAAPPRERKEPRPALPLTRPPAERWQARAREFIAYAQAVLWKPEGKAALDYLTGRGLTYDTIKAAGLGYNPKDDYRPAEQWGVIGKKSIWLPSGIVIPWLIDGAPHRVNIRLLKPRIINGKEIKYIGPAGWGGANPLYNADALTPHKAALLVEGEFDALAVLQEAGDLVTPVATGSTQAGRAGRWVARLAACPVVLVAFDAEPGKGDRAAADWLELLPNGKRWRPLLKDVNDMLTEGLDVRQWIEAGLPAELSPRWVDPEVARLLCEGAPECWPWQLYNEHTHEWVTFSTPAEMLGAVAQVGQAQGAGGGEKSRACISQTAAAVAHTRPRVKQAGRLPEVDFSVVCL